MDDFSLDRTELTGSLISLEFGAGGRIQQLWAVDPALPDETEEFQFCCPPIAMGEETSEDYLPGTILLGARTHPEDPWILSRNSEARPLDDEENEGALVGFEYTFNFLEDLGAIGRFREIHGAVPQIAWDLQIQNRSRRSVEIGELGFPLAFNNFYDGFPRTDEGAKALFNDRVYTHLNVGGAASYLFAQRMNGRPPGLLITPGEDTRWEFACHAPASLNTPFRWEGIPIVYVHSQAAIEREEWPEWFSGHTSTVLEPGEERQYHMRIMCADRYRGDGVHAALAASGRPSMRLFPAGVAPAEVGIAIEVAGVQPATFDTDVEAELETDSDQDGGFCLVRPPEPGPVRLRLEDVQGRESEAFLLFTEPIEDLIKARAAYIAEHQVVKEGPLKYAITPANLIDSGPVVDPDSYLTPFGIESGLSEALYLAEKNALYPDAGQIAILDDYLTNFVEAKILNPGDGSVGSMLPNPDAVAVGHGRGSLYILVSLLYVSMFRAAEAHGASREPAQYRDIAVGIASRLGKHIDLFGYQTLPLLEEIRAARLEFRGGDRTPTVVPPGSSRAISYQRLFADRHLDQAAREHPFWTENGWSAAGFMETAILTESTLNNVRETRPSMPKRHDRAIRYICAARNLSPSWWWYASDKRFGEEYEGIPHPAMPDKGELCLGWSTVANSRRLLAEFEKDGPQTDEARVRMAFGGMLAIWALVRSDGAAGMGFCPDPASKMHGVAWTSGDIGLGLFHYLRGAASYVLPSRTQGVVTFGCAFEVEGQGANETFTIKPWDGVGRRIIVRHVGLDVRAEGLRIVQLRFRADKRSATLWLRNPSDRELSGRVELRGLWGTRFRVDGAEAEAPNGVLAAEIAVPANEVKEVEVEVLG